MIGTPWGEFVTENPVAFHTIGGMPDVEVEIYLYDHTACFGHPTTGQVRISRDGCRSFGGVFPYDFSGLQLDGQNQITLFAHPFALAHLYAGRFVDASIIGHFALFSTGLDSYMSQEVRGKPLNAQLGVESITLVLGTEFDLRVQ